MDDLISRKLAIDAINNIMPTREGFYEPSEVLCKLMQLPSAQPERKTGKWIPIDERLPKVDADGESTYILLSFANYSLPSIGHYQEDDQGGAFYDGDDDKPLNGYGLFINAWMPLPEQYKESDT